LVDIDIWPSPFSHQLHSFGNPNASELLYMTFVVQLGFWVLVFVFKEKISRFFDSE